MVRAQYLIIFTVPRIRIANLGGEEVLQDSTYHKEPDRKETLHKHYINLPDFLSEQCVTVDNEMIL